MRGLALMFVLGCSGGGDDMERCPVGDPAQPAQLEIIHLDAALAVTSTTAGASLPLVAPPQGGWIAMLGARATNIDACRVDLTTSFRDDASTPVIKVDRRPTTLVEDGTGWSVTDVNAIGNLPFCPQVSATRDLHDQPYEITVALDDAYGQHAEQSLVVTPVCPDPDPTGRCLCECAQDYVVGAVCN